MENYFAEQPSGRNLLHVLPPGGASATAPGAVHGGHAPQTSAPAAAENVADQASGRQLVRDSSEYSGASRGLIGRGRGGVEVSPGPSEGDSSRWNDSDAQSGYPYGQGGEAGVAVLTEDDLAVSEDSEAASRLLYGSEMTGEHDTAAGGSSVGGLQYAGGAHASGDPTSRVPGQLHASSRSSLASRVNETYSEASGQHGIIGQGSWRSSPTPRGPGGIRHTLSGETTDSSSLGQQQLMNSQRTDSRDDGDFGTVWLADRAHARHYDAQERR